MTVRRHTRYSTEFKIQLVQAYLDGEGSARAIATRHGVPHSLLMNLGQEIRGRRTYGGDPPAGASCRGPGQDRGTRAQDWSVDDGTRRHEKKGSDTAVTEKRAVVDHLRTRGVPVRRGCSLMNIPRSTFYKRPRCERRTEAVCAGSPRRPDRGSRRGGRAGPKCTLGRAVAVVADKTGGGRPRGVLSRSPTGYGSTSPMMSPCGYRTKPFTRRSTFRDAVRCVGS